MPPAEAGGYLRDINETHRDDFSSNTPVLQLGAIKAQNNKGLQLKQSQEGSLAKALHFLFSEPPDEVGSYSKHMPPAEAGGYLKYLNETR